MTRMIELFEKTYTDTEVTLIAECNEYDNYSRRTEQLSRSYFTFPISMTDEEIITYLENNEYSIYFI
jgi:hypothetical protein